MTVYPYRVTSLHCYYKHSPIHLKACFQGFGAHISFICIKFVGYHMKQRE